MASKTVRFMMWRADKTEMKPVEVECPTDFSRMMMPMK